MPARREVRYQDMTPETFPKGVCFGLDDDEHLKDEPEDVVEGLYAYGPPELPIEIHVYRRVKVPATWCEEVAGRMLDRYVEAWDEEYGDPDSDGADDVDTGSKIEEIKGLVQTWADRSRPWLCEPTGDVLILDAEAVTQITGEAPVEPPKPQEGDACRP